MNSLGFKAALKAYLAATGAVVAYFTGVLDPTALGLEAFADVTTVQWLGAVTTALATFGITWAVPNKELGRHLD
jgi:hypothetical protein